MSVRNGCVAGVVSSVCLCLLATCATGGESPGLSGVETLVSTLATADLSSQEHPLPGYTLSMFADWMNDDILKRKDRKTWTITTVRKSEGFEFVHAETDGLAIRQLPEVFMIGFAPTSPKWRENLPQTVLDFLRANVNGDWDKVQVDPPKTAGGMEFVESAGGGFTHKSGTTRDSFVAVVVEKRVWVCLPKRRNYETLTAWSFVIDSNKRWFSRFPRQR